MSPDDWAFAAVAAFANIAEVMAAAFGSLDAVLGLQTPL